MFVYTRNPDEKTPQDSDINITNIYIQCSNLKK